MVHAAVLCCAVLWVGEDSVLLMDRSFTQMNNSLVIQNSKLLPNFALYAKNNTMIENKKKIESTVKKPFRRRWECYINILSSFR